jgi:hypothetical protein
MTKGRVLAVVFAGVIALLVAAPLNAERTWKPTYRLVASITGVPDKIVPNHSYTYTITIKNTGLRPFPKVAIEFRNGDRVKSSSLRFFRRHGSREGSSVNWVVTDVRPGATRSFTISVVYNARSARPGRYEPNEVVARVPGTPLEVRIRKPSWY